MEHCAFTTQLAKRRARVPAAGVSPRHRRVAVHGDIARERVWRAARVVGDNLAQFLEKWAHNRISFQQA